jgi:hypothetical protein
MSFINLFGNIKLLPSNENPYFINVLAIPTNALASNNIIVKQKHNNVFFHVIKSSNRNNHVLVEIMDKINTIQLEIEQRCSKIQRHNFKENL